jgi:hypothetical protein
MKAAHALNTFPDGDIEPALHEVGDAEKLCSREKESRSRDGSGLITARPICGGHN